MSNLVIRDYKFEVEEKHVFVTRGRTVFSVHFKPVGYDLGTYSYFEFSFRIENDEVKPAWYGYSVYGFTTKGRYRVYKNEKWQEIGLLLAQWHFDKNRLLYITGSLPTSKYDAIDEMLKQA
jgi:hypothetical protein